MITVENLNFKYRNAPDLALRDISFTIDDGEIFGLLGPSGAGKSTVQKVLMGLLKTYEGHVEVFGKELKRWSADYYERVGVSFEFPNHYLKLTAAENLSFYRGLYTGETVDPYTLLELVGLGEDADTRVGHYSKGMKIRLNLARALLHRPDLLFLDEPTSGLDPATARRIKRVILDQRTAGKTVFLTTHDMTVADELCDRVGFIVDGQIRLIDAPGALKHRHGKRVVRVTHDDGAQSEFPLDGLGDDTGFLNLLKTAHIESVHSLEPTLEDIFISVTGTGLT